MQQRELGKGGPKISAIGYGAMSLAGVYGSTTEEQARETLKCCLDTGITHIDTALIYGNGLSEEYVGRFIKDHPNHFSIATKGGIVTQPERRFDNEAGFLRTSLEGSLKRLGVDHIDLYYVHRREQARPIEEVTETLAAFVKEGKIGGFGYSEISPGSLRRANAVHHVRAVQNEYSLWSRQPELGLIRACEELGTAFVAFSPLARGMFGDKVLDLTDLPETDFRRNNPRFQEPNFGYNRAAIQAFADYAMSEGMAPATMALAWVLTRAPNIIAIPGTRTPDHQRQNSAGGDVTLTEAQLARIDALLPPGFAHGDRYSDQQIFGIERYC